MARKKGSGAPKARRPVTPRGVQSPPLTSKLEFWIRLGHILVSLATMALSLKDVHLRGAAFCFFSSCLGLAGLYLQKIRGSPLLRTVLSFCETITLFLTLALLVARSTMLASPQRVAFLERFREFPRSCLHKGSCTRLTPENPQRAPNLRVPVLHASAEEIYKATTEFLALTKRRVHYRHEREPYYVHVEILSQNVGLADSLAMQVVCDPEKSGLAHVWIHTEGSADTGDSGTNYVLVRNLAAYLEALDAGDEQFVGECVPEGISAGADEETEGVSFKEPRLNEL